ncbi:hypothetical protein BH18ACT1_BH18ACT1_10320 [soil metagenome]
MSVRASRRRRRGRRLTLGVATALWCALGLAVPASDGSRVTADEPQYLLSATSLAEDRNLDIADELAEERWRTYHRADLPEQTAARDDGRRLSPHDPLLPLLLAVPVALGGWVGAKLAMAALAGALAVALVAVATRLGVPEHRALLVVATFALTAPLAVYGTQLYPELAGALLVTGGVGAVLARPRRAPAAAMLVVAVGALPWLSVKYAPVAAALGAVGLWRLLVAGQRRLAVATAAGLVATAVLFAAGHLAIYDALTPYAAGDHFTGGELTVMGTEPDYVGRSRRLLGLLVDRDFGLAAWSPAWLLALPAAGALARRRSATDAVLALPLAAGWLVATFFALTMHGWWWPGRQVVVVLPLVVLAIARWGPPARLLVAGLAAGATSYLWLVVEGLADRLTLVVDPWATTNPLLRLWRLVLPDLADPGPVDQFLWAVWLVLAAVLVVAGWGSADADGHRLHQDALAGEGAEAHDPVLDAHGHRAVR